MTKSELTKKLADQFGIPMRHAQLVVDAIFDTMTDALQANEKIAVRGFGAFSLKLRRDRMGYDPRTNKQIRITGKRLISFKPGNKLFAMLNPEM